MKKLIIALVALLAVLIIVILFVVVTRSSSPSSQSSSTATSTNTIFPNSTSSSPENSSSENTSPNISVKTSNGTTYVVKNFETAPATVKDPTNDGYYYLSGGTNVVKTKAPYQIFYDSQDQYFGITLYQEPLGTYRTQAEDELMQELGLGQEEMCNLNYDISVGQGVNDDYLGQNLGFSFCPGAVQLPQ